MELAHLLSLLLLPFFSILVMLFRGKGRNAAIFAIIVSIFALIFSFLELGTVEIPSSFIFYDSYFLFSKTLVFVLLALLSFLSFKNLKKQGIEHRSEFFVLIFFSAFGGIVFANASNLIVLFLGLETMSLSAYALTGIVANDKRAAEGAYKYFIMGGFISAFFLLGVALLYGESGSFNYLEIIKNLEGSDSGIISFSVALILFSILSKLSFVPFHYLQPDVYRGASESTVAFFATVIKTSAFVALYRILYQLFANFYDLYLPFIWFVLCLSLIVASLLAIYQKHLKRFYAYSSIVHGGYLGLLFLSPKGDFLPMFAYYLVIYTFTSIAFFMLILSLRSSKSDKLDFSALQGLFYKCPFRALSLTMVLLSFAGLPPAFGGFFAKFLVIREAVSMSFYGISIIAVFAIILGVYYYLRLIASMFSRDINQHSFASMLFVDRVLIIVLILIFSFALPLYLSP